MKLRNIVAVLLLSLLLPLQALSNESPSSWYNDIEDQHVYRDAIWYMSQKEFVQGYEDGSFKPMQEVNRVEALKMILTAIDAGEADNLEPMTFPDLDEEAWYWDIVNEALNLGIVSGHDDGYFRPADTVNRAEALKMLTLADDVELPELEDAAWYQKYLDFATNNALIVPVAEGEYQPDAALTRGELADIIYRHKKDRFTTQIEFGLASYYADKFEGRTTANGEKYWHSEPTAAHRTLPFDTMVRVTNLNNDLFVDVRINDRGPYAEGKVIDLSASAFDTIGNLSSGILPIRIEVLK